MSTSPDNGARGAAHPLERLAHSRWAWLGVLLAALVARLAFLLTAPHDIPWPDGRAYEATGWILAAQHRYTANFYLPPGYPFFVAGVYSVIGHHLFGLRLVEVLISVLTVGAIGWFGARLVRPEAGLIAAALAALHPVFSILPITHYVETLLLFLATLALGAYACALRRPALPRFMLAGAIYGLVLLVKPTLVAVLPGLALGTTVKLWPRGPAALIRWGGAFVVAVALVVAPWLAHQHAVYDRWFFITAGGGKQFWMGNNPAYAGSTRWNPPPTPAMQDSIRALTHYADLEGLYYREGVRFVRSQPARALSMYFVKMGNLLALYPNTQTRTVYTNSRANLAMGTMSIVLYAGVLLALLLAATNGLGVFLLATVSYTLVCSVFLTVMRYRMSIEVILLWAAGAGWAALIERVLSRRAGYGRPHPFERRP